MRIPSGVTDQYIYFYAVDATDFTTPETGLSTFTVYRSRDGGAAAAFTTPTINETSSANMPGVYELLLDEDMTIGAGNDSEEMVFHISHAGMAPVVRTIELYRPKLTAGETLTVSSGLISNTTAISTVTTATNLTNERGKYANGSVWIGPTANTNTVSYTDGIITNPVSTIAAAKTIADALGMRRFEIIRTGNVQISAALVGYRLSGVGWSANTTGGSQDVGTSAFLGGNITAGTFASTSGTISWERCEFSTGVTIGVSNVLESRFNGAITFSTAGNYDFVDCASSVAGTGTPSFTLPAGTVNVSFRRWSGGITISGITSGSTVSIDMVSGGTVTLNGADGNVQVRGMTAGITDNRTGTPTLGQNAALNRTVLATPTNITAGTLTSVETVTGNVNGSVGSVTGNVGGNVVGSVGSVTGNVGGSVASVTAAVTLPTIPTNWITADGIATDAIGSDELAATAITEIQAGLSTLSAADIRTAVGLATANLDTQLADLPTAAENADAVWDEALSGHLTAGSTGNALNSAGSAGDPWATVLPGAYGAGTAGKIVGDNINAPIGTVDTVVDAIKAKTDNLPASPAAVEDIPTATQNADALLNRDMSAVSDTNARSPLNALRFLRNKFSISGGTLTVTKENDSTTAWTSVVTTDAAADPVTGSDPA